MLVAWVTLVAVVSVDVLLLVCGDVYLLLLLSWRVQDVGVGAYRSKELRSQVGFPLEISEEEGDMLVRFGSALTLLGVG
jgi:hypothetical protein